jgi:hypothetical protein
LPAVHGEHSNSYWRELLAAEREELAHAFERTRTEVNSLCHRFDLESGHVG